MTNLITGFDWVDRRLTAWMGRYGITLLRISLGIVFLWFGALKYFPGLSPAQDLVARTIDVLSFGLVPPPVAVPLVATLEVLIGLGLIFRLAMRVTLLLLFLQMLGTITPLVLFPLETWLRFPIGPTLEGQYIIKNIVLLSAGLVLGSTVRADAVVTGQASA